MSGSTHRDRRALEVLLELTKVLTDDLTLEESLQAVTDGALDLLPGDHASVRLLDATHTELLTGARAGTGASLPPMSFQRGEGLIGWVVDHKEGLRVDETRDDPRFMPDPRGGPQRGFRVRSLVAEPLWSGGNVIGVISVSSPEPHAFGPDDELLVRLLANCCSPPIERVRLRRLAMTDDLTLAYNHRYLLPRLGEEVERARRNGQPLSVLLLDLDHFKRVNDDYGHAIGDTVLRMFTDRVRTVVRRIDVLVRRGGEEFVLVMPATATEHAVQTAERLRKNLEEGALDVGDGLSVTQTVSIGVATLSTGEALQSLLQRADVAMYRAKQLGRNRIEVAKDDEVPMPMSMRSPTSGS